MNDISIRNGWQAGLVIIVLGSIMHAIDSIFF